MWASVDEQLCGLVDQLRTTGYRHTLEAGLRFADAVDYHEEYNLTDLLPKFREKGIVTIVNESDGERLLHSSTHNG